jgi:putative transposase
MHLSHKIRLYPTPEQESQFVQSCGAARFAYNWGLARWTELYGKGEKVDKFSLRREFNALKKTELAWANSVTSRAPMNALLNLGTAFHNFFKKKAGYPTFKKKGKCQDSFMIEGAFVKFESKKLLVTKIGWVKCAEEFRFKENVSIYSLVIKRIADRWYGVVTVKLEDKPAEIADKQSDSVGVDLGLTTFATLSNGMKVEHPRFLKNSLKKLKRLNQNLARKTKDSANGRDARIRLSRCYASIANKRKTFIDKLVKYLFDNFNRVVIEDLNVEGIAQFGNLARSVYDSAWRLFRTTLELKFKGTSKEVIVADRFFPSSKRCHACGKVNHALTLADRDWTCSCGTRHDRDFNAAMNLKLFPMLENAARLAVSACGDLDGRSMKQEFNPLFGG